MMDGGVSSPLPIIKPTNQPLDASSDECPRETLVVVLVEKSFRVGDCQNLWIPTYLPSNNGVQSTFSKE